MRNVTDKQEHLCLFHHEPAAPDAELEQIRKNTIRYSKIYGDGVTVDISSAYDGLELAV